MSEQNPADDISETPVNTAANEAASAGNSAEQNATVENSVEMIGNFPPEIASLLIVAGVAGVLLPGPVGAPLLIAGGVVLWPQTFRPIESWFSRRFPSIHREGVIQLKEFLAL